MEISEHIDALDTYGSLLAAAASAAGLGATVPSCPGWHVRDLLRHIGYVHRWATEYVTAQLSEEAPELNEAEQLSGGAADSELLDWFRAGHLDLVAALRGADPALTAWTFLPAPSPLAFWARRQAHETAIHCADAQLAAGVSPAYPAEFAADGLDELLVAFFGRGPARTEAAGDEAGGAGAPDRVQLVSATDAGRDWHVRLSDDLREIIATGRGLGREPDPGPQGGLAGEQGPGGEQGRGGEQGPGGGTTGGCTLAGPASALYLLLWNRAGLTADVRVAGDSALLDGWHATAHLTWG